MGTNARILRLPEVKCKRNCIRHVLKAISKRPKTLKDSGGHIDCHCIQTLYAYLTESVFLPLDFAFEGIPGRESWFIEKGITNLILKFTQRYLTF